MQTQLKNRPTINKATSIDNYDELRETQRQLSPRDSIAEMRKRRALAKFKSRNRTLTKPMGETTVPRYSQGPFLVGEYDRSSDRFHATSTVQPDEVFLGSPINNGTIGVGDVVRGYHDWGEPQGLLEQKPQGRRFTPQNIPNPVIEEYTVDVIGSIGYTGN